VYADGVGHGRLLLMTTEQPACRKRGKHQTKRKQKRKTQYLNPVRHFMWLVMYSIMFAASAQAAALSAYSTDLQ
jgi:hypothetical protein